VYRNDTSSNDTSPNNISLSNNASNGEPTYMSNNMPLEILNNVPTDVSEGISLDIFNDVPNDKLNNESNDESKKMFITILNDGTFTRNVCIYDAASSIELHLQRYVQ